MVSLGEYEHYDDETGHSADVQQDLYKTDDEVQLPFALQVPSLGGPEEHHVDEED